MVWVLVHLLDGLIKLLVGLGFVAAGELRGAAAWVALGGGPGTAATMKRWPSLSAVTRPRLSIAFIASIGFFNQFSQIIFCKK